LSKDASELVRTLQEVRVSDFIFTGQKPGRPLSAMALEMVLRRNENSSATVHGFWSAFRDWSAQLHQLRQRGL
jgi:hypothetical protein